jgi:hypothetical protein
MAHKTELFAVVTPLNGLPVCEVVKGIHHLVWMDEPLGHLLDPLCYQQMVREIDSVAVKAVAR